MEASLLEVQEYVHKSAGGSTKENKVPTCEGAAGELEADVQCCLLDFLLRRRRRSGFRHRRLGRRVMQDVLAPLFRRNVPALKRLLAI